MSLLFRAFVIVCAVVAVRNKSFEGRPLFCVRWCVTARASRAVHFCRADLCFCKVHLAVHRQQRWARRRRFQISGGNYKPLRKKQSRLLPTRAKWQQLSGAILVGHTLYPITCSPAALRPCPVFHTSCRLCLPVANRSRHALCQHQTVIGLPFRKTHFLQLHGC